MTSNHYALLVDGVPAYVDDDKLDGYSMFIRARNRSFKDINVYGCHSFMWCNDDVTCYDELDNCHDIEVIKHVKLGDFLD